MKKLLTTLAILRIATTSYAKFNAKLYTVERVIDGDTILVSPLFGKWEKIRLIGIETLKRSRRGYY